MRRPHRSIEVFDISLMAVVTKAMGAFLVLMLIFMQYYSSGPIGQKTTSDIRQTIEATEKQIAEAAKKLSQNANPADIAKLLAEAQRLLEQARQQITQLQHENDALNAQVARLENEKAQLEKQIEDLQRKIDAGKTIVSGDLINSDCLDVRLELALITTDMYINREDGKIKDKYVLNFRGLGSSDATDDTDVVKAMPAAANDRPGENYRFNNAAFRYAAEPGNYALIVTKKRLQIQKIRGFDARALTRSKQDCTLTLSLQTASPAKETMLSDFTRKLTVPKDDYATAIYNFKLEGGTLKSGAVSPDVKQWLADQLAHAEKAP